jgi:hypothetical protein
LSVRARRKSCEEKERSRETARYAKILGERASLHEYPLIADSYCVHANKSEWCDNKLAARFGQEQRELKVYGSRAWSVNAPHAPKTRLKSRH